MESIALKKLKSDLPKQVDAALDQHAIQAERWATRVRLCFAVLFAVATAMTWRAPDSRKYIYLGLAVAWLLTLPLVHLRMRKGTSNSLVTLTTLVDFTIINFGLLLFVWQNPQPVAGSGLFLCYFPLLVVAAIRYRAGLVLIAGLYAGSFYALVGLIAPGNPWFRVAILWLTMLICALGSRKPKNLMVGVATQALQDAFNIGAKSREMELNNLFHETVFSAPILDLASIWSSSKHLAGSETAGDYYHVFEDELGPIVILGDLGGQSADGVRDIARLHQQLSSIVLRESALTTVLERLNDYIWTQYQGKRSMTCFIARWAGETLEYINAAHLPVIHLSKERRSKLTANSGALGERQKADFVAETVSFPARDLLLVYTDGLYSKLADNREQGIAEIDNLCEKFSHGEVNTICHRVFDCALPGLEEPKDDCTLVVIRRQPKMTDESKAKSGSGN